MNTIETLDGVTFEMTTIDPQGGLPWKARLALRRDGVTLYKGKRRILWSHLWNAVHGAKHDPTNVWLVGPNESFLQSVDVTGLSERDYAVICAEIRRFQQHYGEPSSKVDSGIDARILFLRQQARARN